MRHEENAAKSIPILCYHRIHTDDDPMMPPVKPNTYCGHVTASEFKRQMDYLAAKGYHTVTQDQIGRWLFEGGSLPARPIALHFDDNRYNVLENGLPVLRAHGFVASMYVITYLAEGKQIWPNDLPAMRWKDLEELVEAGWCIGAHTKTHLTFYEDDYSEEIRPRWVEEIKEPKDIIRAKLGVPVDHFVYPAGIWCEEAEKIVKRYYKTARLWREQLKDTDVPSALSVSRQSNPYRLTCINISAKMSFEAFSILVANAGNA